MAADSFHVKSPVGVSLVVVGKRELRARHQHRLFRAVLFSWGEGSLKGSTYKPPATARNRACEGAGAGLVVSRSITSLREASTGSQERRLLESARESFVRS